MKIFPNSKGYVRQMPKDFQCQHKWVNLTGVIRWCFSCGTAHIGPIGRRSSRVLVPTTSLPDNGPWLLHETEESRRRKLRELL